MPHPRFFKEYSDNLTRVLLQHATQEGFLSGQLLVTDDFDEKWTQIAPEYMADAVTEVIKYPNVAIAWAGFVGVGVAVLWDLQWDKHAYATDTYELLKNPYGFDAMDEYIMGDLLGQDSESDYFKHISAFFYSASNIALTFIRKEDFEPQSKEAYQLFSDTVTVFYRLGASICLHARGYKYHPVGN
jgi:hypothetical protein